MLFKFFGRGAPAIYDEVFETPPISIQLSTATDFAGEILT